MNKKGFTLIELLAVITLIAIIAVIAIPNVVKMVDGSKREMFVSDAKEMITKAKYMYKLDKYASLFTTDGTCKSITLQNLGLDLKKDPDGNTYYVSLCKVKICLENSTYVYYVTTVSSSSNSGVVARGITNVKEANLTKDSITVEGGINWGNSPGDYGTLPD